MLVFFHSIKSRLLFLILLITLPGLLTIFFHAISERNNAIKLARDHATSIVEYITAEQIEIIEEAEVFLKRLSVSNILLTPDNSKCSAFLADLLNLTENYVNLGAPRADGELLCNASPLNKRVNVADRAYIQQAIKTRRFSIGQFQFDRAAQTTSINFAYPVTHPENNQLIALIVAVVSLDWWSKHLEQANLPSNSVAYITDSEEKVIAVYPENKRQLGLPLNKVQGVVQSITDNQTKVMKDTQNRLKIFVNRDLSTANGSHLGSIIVAIPFEKELAAINLRYSQTAIFFIAFILLIVVYAIWSIKKSILSPLSTLKESTKQLEKGLHVDTQLLGGTKELIDLQTHFSSMAKTRLKAEQQLKNSQDLLQESEQLLLRHMQNTPLGTLSWDTDFICTEWNRAAENIFGYSAGEAIGQSVIELIVPVHMRHEFTRNYYLLFENKGGAHFESQHVTKKGVIIVCNWYNTLIINSDGIINGIGTLVQDITESKQTEAKLKLAACVFTHAKEAIMITDAMSNIIDVNNTFVTLSGYSKEEAIGQNPSFFQSGRQSTSFYKAMWQSINTQGKWTGEIWNKRKNGETYPQLITISSVLDNEGKIKNYIALFTDITTIKAHQKQLEHIAHYDLLTGLPNRSLLTDRLLQAIPQCKRYKQSLAVAFLDLDGFKTINDLHGHALGDKLLVQIAQRLKDVLRDGDTLARVGGDEFIVILVDLETHQSSEPILARLLEAASKPISIENAVLSISASIGVTIYPHDNVDAEQLLRHADQAMYTAKQEGKNRYHLFDMLQDTALKHQHSRLVRIRSALQNNELVLYYQPKVNMKTGEVIGAEALIRWQHPEQGLLPPSEFLPIIERHKLTIDVGEWVIKNALSQISLWQKVGLNITVSVNINALHLQQSNFVQRLSDILATYPDVQPRKLQLEVLETSKLGNINNVSQIMHDCIKLGVNFALDDFGTGYCSLTYLKLLPINLIKIDQSFIRDMLDDPDDLSIVKGVIGLSQAFQRSVIAEGVETLQHGNALLKMGCELAQGYGIAKPMPAAQLPDWAIKWRADKPWSDISKY